MDGLLPAGESSRLRSGSTSSPGSTSSSNLLPADLHGQPRGVSSTISEFDVFSYLDEDAQAATPTSMSSSVSFTPHAPVAGSSIKRRGSSRSSSRSAVHDGLDDADTGTGGLAMPPEPSSSMSYGRQHRREVSSASAADIGLREMTHSRQGSSTLSPAFFHAISPREHDSQYNNRPISSGNWSQVSLGFDENEYEGDLGGNTTYTHEDDSDSRDLVLLTRPSQYASHRSTGRPLSNTRNSKRLYDFPAPPDLNLIDDPGISTTNADNSAYPPDLESIPNYLRTSHNRRKTFRAKGTSGYYQRSAGDGVESHVKRRKSLVDTVRTELRRMSIRVVNLKQRDDARHVRLYDSNADDSEEIALDDTENTRYEHDAHFHEGEAESEGQEDPLADEIPTDWAASIGSQLKGRTLGILGPESMLRRVALHILMWPYVS